MYLHRLISTLPLPDLPPKKIFKPKYDLPVLVDFKIQAPDNFWVDFPINLNEPAVASIDAKVLRSLLLETKFPDTVSAGTLPK